MRKRILFIFIIVVLVAVITTAMLLVKKSHDDTSQPTKEAYQNLVQMVSEYKGLDVSPASLKGISVNCLGKDYEVPEEWLDDALALLPEASIKPDSTRIYTDVISQPPGQVCSITLSGDSQPIKFTVLDYDYDSDTIQISMSNNADTADNIEISHITADINNEMKQFSNRICNTFMKLKKIFVNPNNSY